MSAHLIRKLTARDSTLGTASLDRLLGALQAPVTVKAGGTLVEQGSRPEHSTLLVSGWANRYSALRDGRRQTLALHINGDFVDLHSFPLKVMDHGVDAITDCVIAAIDHSALREISEADPHLTRVLWLLTLVDGAILRQWLTSAAVRSSLEHAAYLICELRVRLQSVGMIAHDQPFELPLSQQQFGEALGITSVHVSRTLTVLRKQGLFQWRGAYAQILDWEGLKRLAQFDPTYLNLLDEAR